MRKMIVSTQLYQWECTYGKVTKGQKLANYLDEILRQIADSGFVAIEASLDMVSSEEKAENVEGLLKRHNLTLPSVYSGGIFHKRKEAEEMLKKMVDKAKFARKLGSFLLNVNPATIGRPKTDRELKVQAEFLNRLGASLKEIGLELAIHNHTPAILNDARELRYNCANTDPSLVGLCLDIHWVYRAGIDVYALIEEYADRLKAVHLRNSIDGIWTEALGDGDIDYHVIAHILNKHNFAGLLIVELAYEEKTKITHTIRENSSLSRQYIHKIFGV